MSSLSTGGAPLDLDRSAAVHSQRTGDPSSPRPVWLAAIILSIAVLAFALTRAFVWDEGFHLVAAQEILAGRRPYLDFCFPQTPLNAYWNAAWMRVLGQSWRVPHIPAALEIAGTDLLLTGYLLRRLPAGRWRNPSAFVALLLFATNSVAVQFGPIAQAYALCMLTGFAAFLLALRARQRDSLLSSFGAGLSIGIGAASSLLIAPVFPVLLLWLWLTGGRRRLARCAAFLAGTLPPFVPVLWLWLLAPGPVFFNIVQYQAIFRRADWGTALNAFHDFDVLTGWVDGGQGIVFAGLAVAALVAVHRQRALDPKLRSEYFLALLLSLALLLYISTAHPTFARYYIVGMPLYAVVASPGLMAIGSRMSSDARPFWPTVVVSGVLLLGLLRAQVNDHDAATWHRYEDISREIAKVTPPSTSLFADEQVYFLLHRLPPSGLEFSYSHKVDLPPAEAARLHIIPMQRLKKMVGSGQYQTAETCDDDKIDDWKLGEIFEHRKDIEDCSIFWGFAGSKSGG